MQKINKQQHSIAYNSKKHVQCRPVRQWSKYEAIMQSDCITCVDMFAYLFASYYLTIFISFVLLYRAVCERWFVSCCVLFLIRILYWLSFKMAIITSYRLVGVRLCLLNTLSNFKSIANVVCTCTMNRMYRNRNEYTAKRNENFNSI